MKKFDLIGYIRKYRLLIIVLSVLAGLAAFFVLNRIQTYTASAIICYTNADASKGMAPDGTAIDTTEIYSSQVINRVFSNLNLEYSQYNVDDLRSRVSVTPIKTEEQQALDDAKITQGEEIEGQSVNYQISFLAKRNDSSDTEKFAREFLDELLNVYIQMYGENHINYGVAVNDISNLDGQGYDYLEQAEILRTSVTTAISSLMDKATDNWLFRSSATGYSFADLKREFDLLFHNETSNIYAYILNNQITKNRSVLIDKYENRVNDYLLNNQVTQEQITSINAIIDSYVRMMRESGNTNIVSEYILDEMQDNVYSPDGGKTTNNIDQTVEYEKLLNDYIAANLKYQDALIDIAYCRYIIDIYSGAPAASIQVNAVPEGQQSVPVQEGEPVDAATGDATTENAAMPEEQQNMPIQNEGTMPINEGAIDKTAHTMIDGLVSELGSLYSVLETTNSEFNEYAGSQNINMVSGIAVAPSFQMLLYVALLVVAFGFIGCMGAVIIGRIGDIFEYYVYIDHKQEIPNRVACDRYISSCKKKVLNEEFVCISIRISELKNKNEMYGRDIIDNTLKRFSGILQNIFSGEDNVFCGLNAAGQYLVFSKDLGIERACTYMEQLKNQVEEYNLAVNCKISYMAGIAEAHTQGIYEVRELMLKAMLLNNASLVETAQADSVTSVDLQKKLDELRSKLANI